MNDERTQILHQIRQILASDCQVPIESIHIQSRLLEDLQLESVDLLTLAVQLENHFQLVLQENLEQPPHTISDMIDLIQKSMHHE